MLVLIHKSLGLTLRWQYTDGILRDLVTVSYVGGGTLRLTRKLNEVLLYVT